MIIPLCLLTLYSMHAAAASGHIAYLSGTEQEDLCVCVMDVVSGATLRVGEGDRDGAPVWSPDGAWLAYPSKSDAGMDIHLVRPDGSERRAVVHAHPWNRQPRWSPDGSRLAYAADDGINAVIMVYDAVTHTETVWGGGKTGLMRPVWVSGMKLLNIVKQIEESQHGESRISGMFDEINGTGAILAVGLVANSNGLTTDIFLVTENGATPLVPPELNPGNYVDWAVEINRKGGMIAFESNDGGDREIFVFSANGQTNVTNHREADWNPVWSPDGNWIAFESFRNARRSVYRVYPETIRVFPVAVAKNSDNWCPTWSPDGEWLAFVSDRTGNPDIWIAEVTGENPRQLTTYPGLDYAPAWQPRKAP